MSVRALDPSKRGPARRRSKEDRLLPAVCLSVVHLGGQLARVSTGIEPVRVLANFALRAVLAGMSAVQETVLLIVVMFVLVLHDR